MGAWLDPANTLDWGTGERPCTGFTNIAISAYMILLGLMIAGSAEARSAALGGYQALVRQARVQARLLQPHQTVAVLEALAAGAAAVDPSTASAPAMSAQMFEL